RGRSYRQNKQPAGSTAHRLEPRPSTCHSAKTRIHLAMDTLLESLYQLPFYVLVVPNLKLKRPSWWALPSAMTVYSLVLLSYFLVCGGKLARALLDEYLNDYRHFSQE